MRKSFSEQVKAAAAGRWPETLQSMAIPAKSLDGKNHPCPACGGDDRFQFTARGAGADYGRFACRGMDSGGGDGFALVMHVFNLSFPEAVIAVGRVLGMDQQHNACTTFTLPELPKHKPTETQLKTQFKTQDRTAQRQALFDSGVALSSSNMAGLYLLNRGLAGRYLPTQADSPLRHIAALDYWHESNGSSKRLKTTPALIAKIQKPNGALAGLHRIYLEPKGHKLVLHDETGKALASKKLQLAHDGALSGAACRLHPIGDDGRLALTEGIETALAVHQLTGLAVWSCINVAMLKTVVLPDSVREVVIYGDNDLPDHKGKNAGKEAAYILAARLVGEGRTVKVMLPPEAGTDWLDVLNDDNAAVA
ncbi:toprim domain-containing protein [Deefgea salmonis]|uniref:Toprim domain-containing protein n=1 Tax=Deefgea salmonis TaxID=2875502 RepID=A0ABS8BIR9_9NEIS|nr:toprim domain-containing protein [Deefgea salmonis]MCB5195517.1 toprim domain-containing protein [Deefgea salmonis]